MTLLWLSDEQAPCQGGAPWPGSQTPIPAPSPGAPAVSLAPCLQQHRQTFHLIARQITVRAQDGNHWPSQGVLGNLQPAKATWHFSCAA